MFLLRVDYGANFTFSFISKTSDGLPCHHPFGLAAATLARLDAGEAVATATISLNSSLNAAAADRAVRTETASDLLLLRRAGDIAIILNNPPANFGCVGQPYAGVGAAYAAFLLGGLPGANAPSIRLRGPAATLNLDNPVSQSAESPLSSAGPISLGGGKWTFLASAGMAAPASVDFALPSPVRITNAFPLSFARDRDQTITWDGGGFDPSATARLSVTTGGGSQSVLMCSASAQSGAITIPAALIAALSPNSTVALSLTVAQPWIGFSGGLLANQSPPELLVAVSWQSSDTRPVDVQ